MSGNTSLPVQTLSLRTAYYTAISLVLYFIPTLVMSVAYMVIIYRLWSAQPPGERVEGVTEVSAQVKTKRKVRDTQPPAITLHVTCLQWPVLISLENYFS